MSEWKRVRIGDLGRVVTGATPPTKKPEYYDGDYLFVTPSDLVYDTWQVTRTERTISDAGYQKYSTRCVPSGAIVYTCIASIGKIGIASGTVLTNQQINSIIANEENDGRFIYHLLRFNTERIKGLNAGCAVPIINKTDFENIEVDVPPLPLQRRIADILSAYDDLIENNRRRIEILEETARTLYRKMFVAGARPEWSVVKVADILGKVSRCEKIPKEEYSIEGSYPCVDQGKDFFGGYTDRESAVIRDLPMIVFGDHTRIWKFLREPFASGADGTQLICAKDKRISQEFLYYALSSIDLTNYFYARHFKILKSKEITLPDNIEISRFTDIVRPMTECVSLLRIQNRKLAAARDLLLPRLMSGRLRVGAAAGRGKREVA